MIPEEVADEEADLLESLQVALEEVARGEVRQFPDVRSLLQDLFSDDE